MLPGLRIKAIGRVYTNFGIRIEVPITIAGNTSLIDPDGGLFVTHDRDKTSESAMPTFNTRQVVGHSTHETGLRKVGKTACPRNLGPTVSCNSVDHLLLATRLREGRQPLPRVPKWVV